MSHNKHCYVKKINKSAVQGSRRVDLMFKQASLKAFTSDFDVCDKDLVIDSVSSATCIESTNQSINLICLRPLALLHVKQIQSRSLVVVQALSLRMKCQFLMPGCFHLGNMREDLHGFIIMWRKGAIVASYVRYFVHFCFEQLTHSALNGFN